MIHLLAYALEAVANTLSLISEPVGKLLGILITLGTLMDIIPYMFNIIRVIRLH